MDERKKMKKGYLIKWYELYGDIYIVRDSGMGIIMNVIETHGEKVYQVYRLKEKDKRNFYYHEIELINGVKE
jgi:hypothetical protein